MALGAFYAALRFYREKVPDGCARQHSANNCGSERGKKPKSGERLPPKHEGRQPKPTPFDATEPQSYFDLPAL